MGSYVYQLDPNFKTPAESMVETGWRTADSRADSAYHLATSWMGAIASVDIPFTAVTSGFTAPAISYTLNLPAAPIAPDVSFPAIAAPDDLNLAYVPPVVPAAVPTFDDTAPTIQILDKPDALSATPPGDAPAVSDVTLPDAPAIVLPSAPIMELITIPTAPTLDLPVWAGVAPDGSGLVAPSIDLLWSEAYYDSDLLNSVSSRLTTMLAGGTGLPPSIEQAIWDRGRAREDVIARKATQEAYEEFASRGFALPTGSLAGRVAEVWQKNREAGSTYSRDVAIKQAELEIENLKFSVTTGIQLEGQLMTYAGQYAQRALEAAKATVEVAINIFNAHVAMYNAQLQAYQTEATVYKELIQAEALRLEQYRTQIEAQKLIGDINMQAIQIYKTSIDALMASVELYKAELEGVKTVVEVDRVRIEGFRATVDAYKALVDAKTSEYQAWAESIKGEATKVSIYEAQARTYNTLVDAYKTGETVKIENMKAQLDANELLVKAFSAEVDYLAEQVKAAVAQVSTGVQIYDGQAKVYSSQISGEQARVQALAEQTRLIIASGTADAELKLKAANINVEQLLRIGTVEQEGRKASGMIAGQLAASAMSSFNLGASVSSGWSEGVSNQLTENHNLSS
jgi:hypothetical protein